MRQNPSFGVCVKGRGDDEEAKVKYPAKSTDAMFAQDFGLRIVTKKSGQTSRDGIVRGRKRDSRNAPKFYGCTECVHLARRVEECVPTKHHICF